MICPRPATGLIRDVDPHGSGRPRAGIAGAGAGVGRIRGLVTRGRSQCRGQSGGQLGDPIEQVRAGSMNEVAHLWIGDDGPDGALEQTERFPDVVGPGTAPGLRPGTFVVV
jgi:hypothetical protein